MLQSRLFTSPRRQQRERLSLLETGAAVNPSPFQPGRGAAASTPLL